MVAPLYPRAPQYQAFSKVFSLPVKSCLLWDQTVQFNLQVRLFSSLFADFPAGIGSSLLYIIGPGRVPLEGGMR